MLSTTLPAIDGHEIGRHPLVCRLLPFSTNGLQKLGHSYIWDADMVIGQFRELRPNAELSLKLATYKTALLLALATYARTAELACIDYANIRQENGKMFL